MAINISFGGANIRRPGSYSTVDSSNMTPKTTGAFSVLAFVGQLTDPTATLAPATPSYFNNPADAKSALTSGEVLDCVNIAWAHGADLIAIVRVDNAVQATGVLNSASAVPSINLTAKQYGTNGNSIQYNVTGTGATASVVITNGIVTETYVIGTQTVTQLVASINAGSTLVVASVATGATAVPTLPTTATSMSGGAVGANPANTDWQNAVNALQTEFIDGIVPITATGALQVIVDTHCTTMASVLNKKERRAFYGHANGLTLAQIQALPATITTSERGVFASPGVYYNIAGVKTLKPSYYLASAYAGIWASQNPQEPITFKYVNFPAVETNFLGTDIVSLLGSQVAPVEVVKGKGFRIVQGITMNNSNDLSKVELSVSYLKDVMSRTVRDYMTDKYVGHASKIGIVTSIYNDLVSLCELFIKNNWISAYDKTSISVVQNGTAFTLNWSGTPTLPINDFLITSHFTLS